MDGSIAFYTCLAYTTIMIFLLSLVNELSCVQIARSGFEQVEALEFLAALIPQIYQESSKTSKSRDQLPLDTLHQMIMSHSKFLETLLASTSTAATDTVEGESDALDSEQQLRTRRKGGIYA